MSIFDGLPLPKDKSFLKEELSRIDESWAAARFDSLPHVVHILTSKNREAEVQVLKEQSDIVEEVVDEVVHAYHGGFNKAIQNYSQILRLFSESAESIGELKVDLAQAKKLLGAHNKQLHQLWYRSVTLRHIISLLDQIEGIAKVPARIEKLIAEKQFYAAVQLHVQSSLMLEREGLQAVGALQDVRSELTKLRGAFFYKVLEDLHSHLYNKGEYSSVVSSMLESDDAIPTATAGMSSMNYSHSLSRRTRLLKGDGDGVYRPSSVDGGSSFDGHNEDGTLDVHDDAAPNGYTPKANGGGDARTLSRQIPVWLSDSTPDEFVEAVRKSDAPLHVKYLQTLVECLSMLGKVAAAGAIISQRLRPTIHDIITAKIKAQAGRASGPRPGLGHTASPTVTGLHYLKGQLEQHLAKQKRQNGVSPAGALAVSPVSHIMSPSGTAQTSARELLDSILDTVVRIFENHVIVGELLESKSSQQSHMNTPKAMVADVSWNNDSDASSDTGGFTIDFSLNVLQSECQQLICEILRKLHLQMRLYRQLDLLARILLRTRGMDQKMDLPSRSGSLMLVLPFLTRGWRKGSNVLQEGYGTGAMLPEQGTYLAASVYRPVVQEFSLQTTLHQCFLKSSPNLDHRKCVQQAVSSKSTNYQMLRISVQQAVESTIKRLRT